MLLAAIAGCTDGTVPAPTPPDPIVSQTDSNPPPLQPETRIPESSGTPKVAVKPAEVPESPATTADLSPSGIEPDQATPKNDAAAPPVAAADPTVPPTVPAGPRKVELLIKERTFKPEAGTQALRVSFDDLDLLKVLNMEPVTNDAVEKMPQWLRDLDGKQVIIRGFMRQAFSETGLTDFIMVRDMGLCCFGPNPKIYDMIQVTMKAGTTTDYIELKPFDVTGKFRIEMGVEDDLMYGLYYIDDARIVPRR